ncbi:MAG TPA: DUF892 family protein [Gemmataceae bacterium]|jgi:ferritin-like metal-binding protein YciE|nr:DUF892 family protein [Gemmataceae bacterium]
MPLQTLHDLYVEELRELVSAEDQLVKALPQLAKAASAPELRTAFARHAAETEGHTERLGLILGALDIKTTSIKCKAMAGLIAEAKDLMKMDAHPAVLDLALIGAALRIEHYEIAAYECARTYARRLGHKDAVHLLAQTLEEEEEEEERLGLMADAVILVEAAAATKAAKTKGRQAKK